MLIAFVLAAILIILPQTLSSETMKLVDIETGDIMIEFIEGRVQFLHWFLERVLTNKGIFIPPYLQSEFRNKKAIFPDDPLFQKAFIEVYCKFSLTDPSYQWIREPTQNPLK